MAFTKSKNVQKLKDALLAARGKSSQLTDEQTQFSFPNTKRVINVYTTGTVTGQGPSDAGLDETVEAHIISTNAQA